MSGSELSGDQLRAALFDAVAAGDGPRFATLCDQHEAAVVDGFDGWRKVPEAFRVPDRIAWYSQGLITVAGYFAERRGKPELRELLVGNANDNPVVRWERALRSIDPLVAALDFERAAEILRDALTAGEQLQGNAVDGTALPSGRAAGRGHASAVERYLPVTCGRLGECLFQLGDADAAAEHTARALALSQASGDRDGERIYLGNLAEIERYRGHTAAAARHFAQLANAIEAARPDPGAVAVYRRRAAIVAAGEPACRVVGLVDGWRFEVDELVRSPPALQVRFVFERNRVALLRSSAAVQAGVEAGTRGEPEAALRHFETAAAADPKDPWPHYHAGMALLELGRYAEAAESYAATEARAPGWYQCRADRWLAEQLAAGAIDRDAFLAVRTLDDPQMQAAEAVDIAEAARARYPIPALDLALGNALRQLRRDAAAEAAYRRGLETAIEPDVRTRLLVALGGLVTGDARAPLLREAVELGGNLVAAAMATLILSTATTA